MSTSKTHSLTRKILFLFCLAFILLSLCSATYARPALARDGSGTVPPNMQTLHCPWFSVADDLVSLVMLKNTTGSEMNVYLSIRYGASADDDGNYDLEDPITLGPSEDRSINLRQLISQHRKVIKKANTGGIELSFFGNPNDLIAKTYVMSMKHHLSFDVPFVNPVLVNSSIMDSVWWYVGGDYRSFIELKNTTNDDVYVTLMVRHGKDDVTQQSFVIPARQSRAVDVKELKPVLGGVVSGGAEIMHTGSPGAIVANTTIMSRTLGLSFNSQFIPRTISKE
ncbi:MAG TPA: hypothetical protein VFC63_23825 [Blastocatellia bacterium]|nr:hypothetical protein [Blastocatellia bacterium]